jgi:hypothetical protein
MSMGKSIPAMAGSPAVLVRCIASCSTPMHIDPPPASGSWTAKDTRRSRAMSGERFISQRASDEQMGYSPESTRPWIKRPVRPSME